jgi:crotonobetainyl-CoA:carnitine CoA-transferase CaiB-like acyl-CoA transferase
MQWVEPVTLPGSNGTTTASKTVISPQRVSGERLGVYRNPPALGEHTAEVIKNSIRTNS